MVLPRKIFQRKYINTTIKFVKEGNIQKAEKTIKPAIRHLIKKGCKSIILGCTELPLAFQKNKLLKNFIDANLILAIASMKKYKSF